MDYTPTDLQVELADLVERIGREHQGIRQAQPGGHIDKAAWQALVEAGLIGTAVSDNLGGSGLGFLDLAAVLCVIGAQGLNVPFLHAAIGAMFVARFGDAALAQRLVPTAVAGQAVIVPALGEPGTIDPRETRATASPADHGWTVSGRRVRVPYAQQASHVLVQAATPNGIGVFVVDTTRPGVTITPIETRSDLPLAEIHFDAALADAAVGEPHAALEWLIAALRIALAAVQFGTGRSALKLTADWIAQRRQFGRALAEFQVVSLRMADALMALEANRLTMWQAAYLLSEDEPAGEAAAIAKYWAAEAGAVVVTTTHLLHGGVGVDLSYGLARLSVISRRIEQELGGTQANLSDIGRAIAGYHHNRPVGALA